MNRVLLLGSALFMSLGVIIALTERDFSRLGSIFSAVAVTAFIWILWLRARRRNARTRVPSYIAEKARVETEIASGSEFAAVLENLHGRYVEFRRVRGVSMRGLCEVIDMKGAIAVLRICVKNGRVLAIKVYPAQPVR